VCGTVGVALWVWYYGCGTVGVLYSLLNYGMYITEHSTWAIFVALPVVVMDDDVDTSL